MVAPCWCGFSRLICPLPHLADLAVEALELTHFHASLGTAHQQLQRRSRRLIELVPNFLNDRGVKHGALQLSDRCVIREASAVNAPYLRQRRQHAGVIVVQRRQQGFHLGGVPAPTRASVDVKVIGDLGIVVGAVDDTCWRGAGGANEIDETLFVRLQCRCQIIKDAAELAFE